VSARALGPGPALSDYVRLIRHGWKVIAGSVITLGALALALSLAQSERFTATADVRVRGSSLEAAIAVARSRDFQRDVVPRVDRERVLVTMEGRQTLRFAVELNQANSAARAANAYAAALVDRFEGRSNVTRAEIPDGPSQPATARNVALACALGMTLSLWWLLRPSRT